MPTKPAPKPTAEKSRPEKLPPRDNIPNESPQSDGIPKPPPQKELGPEFWVEKEEDFSGLDRQGGFFDIDGSTWNPYDSGYVNHEDNYEDVEDGTGGFEEWDNDDGRRHDGVNEERMTPVEMARRRLAQNTGHDPSTQIPPPLLPQDIIQYYTEIPPLSGGRARPPGWH